MDKKDAGFELTEWVEQSPQEYNRYAIYKEKVQATVDQLHALCKEHKLPLAMVICHTQNADGTNAVAHAQYVPSAGEAVAEVMMAGEASRGDVRNIMAIHLADLVRCERARAAKPASAAHHPAPETIQ